MITDLENRPETQNGGVVGRLWAVPSVQISCFRKVRDVDSGMFQE